MGVNRVVEVIAGGSGCFEEGKWRMVKCVASLLWGRKKWSESIKMSLDCDRIHMGDTWAIIKNIEWCKSITRGTTTKVILCRKFFAAEKSIKLLLVLIPPNRPCFRRLYPTNRNDIIYTHTQSYSLCSIPSFIQKNILTSQSTKNNTTTTTTSSHHEHHHLVIHDYCTTHYIIIINIFQQHHPPQHFTNNTSRLCIDL